MLKTNKKIIMLLNQSFLVSFKALYNFQYKCYANQLIYMTNLTIVIPAKYESESLPVVLDQFIDVMMFVLFLKNLTQNNKFN